MGKSKLNITKALAVLARESFPVFVNLIFKARYGKEYLFNFHTYEIIENLVKTEDSIIISAPPRSGKSQLVILFLLWKLATNPHCSFCVATYGAELSTKHLSEIRAMVQLDIFRVIFPNFLLESNRKNEIRLKGYSGGIYAVGVHGGITGRGFDLVVIDDPHKNESDSSSHAKRETIYSWYESELLTRLTPTGRIVIIMTRWSVNDLTGYILSNPNNKYRELKYKAIATEDEPPHRLKGEALHPARYDINFYNMQKKAISSYRFSSLYQQEPIAQGAGLIRREFFESFNSQECNRLTFDFVRVYCDTASKRGAANDYTCFLLAGAKGFYNEYGRFDYNVYVLDIFHEKVEGAKLKEKLEGFYQRNSKRFAIDRVLIEDASSGVFLFQQLRQSGVLPIKAVTVRDSKFMRLNGVLGFIENQRVFLDYNAAYYKDFIEELEQIGFNDDGKETHRHDDQTDSLIMAIADIILNRLVTKN